MDRDIGIDLEAGATGLRYHWPGATPGEHTAALIVPDADGNAAAIRWTFTVGDGPDAAAGLLGGATPGDPSPFEVILLALAALLAAGGLFALARGMLNGRGGRLVPVLATAVIVGGFPATQAALAEVGMAGARFERERTRFDPGIRQVLQVSPLAA